MALPQTIGTSLEISNTGYAGPFRASNGDHYVVLQVTTNKDVVAVYKADNGDNTWSEQDSANRPITTQVSDRQGLCATLVGTTIHIATWGSSGSNRRVHYHAFSTSSDTWTTTEELVAGPFTTNTGDGTVSMEVRSDGDKIIFYQGPYENVGGTNYDRIYYAVHQGTAWTDASGSLSTGTTKQWRHVYTVKGASDKVHVFYSDESALEVSHVSFDSTNSLSSVEVVTTTSSANPISRPAYYDNAGAETIVVGIMEGTTAKRFAVVNDGSPSSAETVSDVAVHQDFAGAHRSFGMAVDDTNNVEYMGYVDSSTQDLWYDVRSGGSWGTDTEVLDAITGKRLCVNCFVIDNGDTVLAYVYNDNNTIKYHETVVAAASGGVTVNVGTGTLTSSGQAASVTPGAVSVSVNSGSLTASGQAVTVTPGAVTVSVNSGSIAASGESLTVTPGAVSVAVNNGTLAASGQAVTVTPGAVSISVGTASLSASGQSLTVVPGSVSVALNAGSLTLSGQTISAGGGVRVSVGTGAITSSGQAAAVVPGAISVSLASGVITTSGQAVTVSASNNTVTVNVATGALSMAGAALVVVPGATTVSVNAGALAVSGQVVGASSPESYFPEPGPAYMTPRVNFDAPEMVAYDEHRLPERRVTGEIVTYTTRKGRI